MKRNIIQDNLAFSMRCKECGYEIDIGDCGIIEGIVGISEHIEKFEHTKFELEIVDFDLSFITETRDVVKLFENDEPLILRYMLTKLKDIGYENNAGIVIKNATESDIIKIDDIKENDIYFNLTDFGMNLLEEIKKGQQDQK